MKRLAIGLSLVLLAISAAGAELRPFAELWNNFAYYDTNLERKGYDSILGHYEGKVGFWVFDTPFQAYGAYYGMTAQTSDYFDNSLFTGAGVRVKPFEAVFPGTNWANEWIRDIKVSSRKQFIHQEIGFPGIVSLLGNKLDVLQHVL